MIGPLGNVGVEALDQGGELGGELERAAADDLAILAAMDPFGDRAAFMVELAHPVIEVAGAVGLGRVVKLEDLAMPLGEDLADHFAG
ncbi:hypothetical protein [Novosphingobium sp.]|uniref:hypothetical protein n=1 Tax=Novosphingobium sp. TaxID=1874826 RepID=UPI00286E3EB7|nr:hypothetical protein [Novosphingobium sp.]